MDDDTRDLLREAGEVLHGGRWQSELARDLGVTDRTMRRWVSGEHAMPEAVLGELLQLCEHRAGRLAAVVKQLQSISGKL